MDPYDTLKDKLARISGDLSALTTRGRSIPGMDEDLFGDYEKIRVSIDEQLTEEIIRFAVVGPIKSGKSTFINSLLGEDYLKRGAGVVTSIVTRVRGGQSLNARLFFKSWDEVNADMTRAMVLFPSMNDESSPGSFDIRRKADRSAPWDALARLAADRLITDDARDINSVLLTSYLKGYDAVQEIVSSETVTRRFGADEFPKHREFVGDDSLAVYLRDIELEVPGDRLDRHIEIADCQGSDSPNPLHLAMIQDYLLLTHFLIYVISSRTGLRRADIHFLSMIRKMGIMDNILFVINCDCSEHESLEDLLAIVDKTREDLALLKPDPAIFTVSALLNLFTRRAESLTRKDQLRLEQWREDQAMVAFLDEEKERFQSTFRRTLAGERFSLLLGNHLDRMGVIAAGIDQWAALTRDILSRDESGAREVIGKLTRHQEKIKGIRAVMKSTIDGASRELKKELKTEIDRFLDDRTGQVIADIKAFIRNFQPSANAYEEEIRSAGFTTALFLVFQEFKQALDVFMAENINPEVIRFIRENERNIKARFDSVVDPYDAMVRDALAEYDGLLERFGVNKFHQDRRKVELPDMDAIRGAAGLTLPPASARMDYTAKIKTEAVLRFGFYRLLRLFKRAFKKAEAVDQEEGIRALKDGVRRMKRDTEKAIQSHFKNYRENIKFAYFSKLVDAASNRLHETLFERFQGYGEDLSRGARLVSRTRTDQARAREILDQMAGESRKVKENLSAVRERIEIAAEKRE
ncbi:MAG: hypothetical protein GY859_39705 [Desulfobacterales bacterium]|nr:hypothetical protein [Desulfobacterales bacterium]